MNKESFSWKKLMGYRLLLPIACLCLVMIINVIKTPTFFNISMQNGVFYGYIIDIINRSSELIILAVGMTLVVAASAGTDISVGAVCAVAGAASIFMLGSGETYKIPYVLGLLIAIAVGGLCGAWNGFLVAKMRIQPMVATLILFTAGRGIAQLITDGKILYVKVEQFKYLGSTLPIGNGRLPIPTPILIAIIVVVITSIVLKKTALGMYIEAVGINPKASRIVGLNSTMIIFLAYTFCGICSGIAGTIVTSRVYSIDANNAGLNLELDAILAVALGGNSLGGGKFSLAGSVIGAITIQALTTSLYAMKVTADQLPIYKAIVVIIIVSLQSPEFKRMFQGMKIRLAGKKVA